MADKNLKFYPKNIDEFTEYTKSMLRINVGKTARTILYMCLTMDMIVFIMFFVVDLYGHVPATPQLDMVFNAMNYISSACIGFLFGHSQDSDSGLNRGHEIRHNDDEVDRNETLS